MIAEHIAVLNANQAIRDYQHNLLKQERITATELQIFSELIRAAQDAKFAHWLACQKDGKYSKISLADLAPF